MMRMKGEKRETMPAYRVVMWNEEDGTFSVPQTAVFASESDAQIYERIWTEEGHIVRVCDSEEDYNYPLYCMDETAVFLLRRFSRPFTDEPNRTGELVFHQLIYGKFGTGPDESEYNFAGVVWQNGTFIPYDTLRRLTTEEVKEWEETLRNGAKWF
jgi:hypothetical protein